MTVFWDKVPYGLVEVVLGGLVLATGPKGHGFIPCRGDGFLRAIKIRTTSFCEGKEKTEAPFRKI
jgi:hypothetical protein